MAASPKSCFVNSSRISHFGMKPVRGGSPAKDRRINGAVAVKLGFLVQEMAKELIVVDLIIFSVRKAEEVIFKYKIRFMRARGGENWITRIIQPRWAVEE